MLQPAGDLGLQEEALAALVVVGVLVEDLLERHLAVQLVVQGHEDGPQAALGVGPQHAKPLALGRDGTDGVAGGAVGDRPGRPYLGADVGERGLQVGIREAGQALEGRAANGHGRQALLRGRRRAS